MSPSLIWSFIKALPEIIQLLKILEARLSEAEAERKVKDDVKTIHQALSSNDPQKLRALFAGTDPNVVREQTSSN